MGVLLQVLVAGLGSVGALGGVLGGASGGASGGTVYDQRQSGKTNVRVELRDAVIVAIGDGEFGGDYDYHYDYSDLTIKPSSQMPTTAATAASTGAPQRPTTPKPTAAPTTSAAAVNITQNAAVVLEAENNSIIFPAIAKPGGAAGEPIKIPAAGAYGPDQIPVLVLQEVHRPNKFLPVKTVVKEEVPTQTPGGGAINPKELPTRHCAPGFSLDNQNRCRRIRRPTRERPQLPIGLRFDHRPLIRS